MSSCVKVCVRKHVLLRGVHVRVTAHGGHVPEHALEDDCVRYVDNSAFYLDGPNWINIEVDFGAYTSSTCLVGSWPKVTEKGQCCPIGTAQNGRNLPTKSERWAKHGRHSGTVHGPHSGLRTDQGNVCSRHRLLPTTPTQRPTRSRSFDNRCANKLQRCAFAVVVPLPVCLACIRLLPALVSTAYSPQAPESSGRLGHIPMTQGRWRTKAHQKPTSS